MTWQAFFAALGGGLLALVGGGATLVLIQRAWLEEEREELADAIRQIRSLRPPSQDASKGSPPQRSSSPGYDNRWPYPYHTSGQPVAGDMRGDIGRLNYRRGSDFPPYYSSYD